MMFDDLKRKLLTKGLVEKVREELGDKAENIRLEDGSIKADPSDELIEKIGSEEKADAHIEKETKKLIKKYMGTLLSSAEKKGKISKTKVKNVDEKIKKELK